MASKTFRRSSTLPLAAAILFAVGLVQLFATRQPAVASAAPTDGGGGGDALDGGRLLLLDSGLAIGGGPGGAAPRRRIGKRPFVEANCRGSYEPHFDAFVHRLDRLCTECADMFPSMRDMIDQRCHVECYRNEVFRDCLSAVMIDTEEIDRMIGELAGK